MEAVTESLGSLELSAKAVKDGSKTGAQVTEFLDSEKDAAVLRLRKSFLTQSEEASAVTKITAEWMRYILPETRGVFATTKGIDDGATPSRLQKEDVVRTFASEPNRAMLLDLVVRLQQVLGDYSQAMCFVQAFCAIFFEPKRAFELTVTLGQSDHYVGNRWWDRVAFGTEAFAFLEMLRLHDLQVFKHLESLYVLPEAYTQRWFLALGVNVIPYVYLLPLMDAFLKDGAVVLHRFGLAIIKTCRKELLEAKETGRILSILNQPPESKCDEIVSLSRAEKNGIMLNSHQLSHYRELALEKYRSRLFVVKGVDSTRKHTGETDSEDDSEDDSENPECLICHDNMADRFCKTCDILLCNRCHKKEKKDHKNTHETEETENWEFEKLVETFLKLK